MFKSCSLAIKCGIWALCDLTISTCLDWQGSALLTWMEKNTVRLNKGRYGRPGSHTLTRTGTSLWKECDSELAFTLTAAFHLDLLLYWGTTSENNASLWTCFYCLISLTFTVNHGNSQLGFKTTPLLLVWVVCSPEEPRTTWLREFSFSWPRWEKLLASECNSVSDGLKLLRLRRGL